MSPSFPTNEVPPAPPLASCRLCTRPLSGPPLLRYANMPAAAQHLPDAQNLAQDRGIPLEVFACAGCGLIQLLGPPVPYFREVIRAAAFSDEMREFRRVQFRAFVERYALAGKKVLEIGCGRGEYLTILQESGANAWGLEYAADSVAHCRAHGLQASQGFIASDAYPIPEAPFAGFFMLSFLEHLPDPGMVLRGIAGNLTEDAVGMVEVPNFDFILREGLFSEFVTDHLCYFTKATLGMLLALSGFEIVTCDEVWHDYILSAVVRRRPRADLGQLSDGKARLTQELRSFIRRFPGRRVAIWGAGHQALALLALAELGDQVRYVVDSAPFKQGKFTPATHVAIVSPAALATDPVDAVLVMAAAYADEVVRALRRSYGNRLAIAVVRNDRLTVEPE
jgi:2-polyprenyl-3-methyl-5-hydroxy-6-metoxy-1,4-benzoquinol methylase